jgi:hypothetical protein
VTLKAGDPHAAPFIELAKRVEQRCAEIGSSAPTITVED